MIKRAGRIICTKGHLCGKKCIHSDWHYPIRRGENSCGQCSVMEDQECITWEEGRRRIWERREELKKWIDLDRLDYPDS